MAAPSTASHGRRFPPHNLYTTGKNLRSLGKRIGAKDKADQAGLAVRAGRPARRSGPYGGTIQVNYPANVIKYKYDRTTNTYLRSVTGESRSRPTPATASGSPPRTWS